VSTIRLFSGNQPEPALTVRQVIAAYLDQKALDHLAGAFSLKALESARHYLGRFAKDFGDLPVSQCHKNDLTHWLLKHPEWESTFTRHDAVGRVVTCFYWAEDELGIVSRYRRPKFVGAPLRPRPAIEPAEYRAMQRYARRARNTRRMLRTRNVFRAALSFLWRTGARPCEMRTAQWTELDWRREIIVTKNKTEKATGKDRMIPVGSVMHLLRWLYRRKKPGQTHIFTNTLGKPWTADRFAKEFRRYANLAGVRQKVSAYCLRHGMCVRLLEKGEGERQIADVLGHESTRYVSWYGRTTRTMADYLNDVIRRKKRP